MDKAMNLLTICRRAGKLELGADPVKDACRSFKAKCVCVSPDLSPKSLKEIKFVCKECSVPLYQLETGMDDIWASLGKKVGVVAVCDFGFKKKLSTMLSAVEI